MIQIEEYILQPKEIRQQHLDLSTPCVFRNSTSYYDKGMLASFLDTTVPRAKKIFLCHACHDGSCSNPQHQYWGTPKENVADAVSNGVETVWERTVKKYGLKKARQIQSRKRNIGGSGNKGKEKTQEHKDAIRASLLGRKRGKYNKGK